MKLFIISWRLFEMLESQLSEEFTLLERSMKANLSQANYFLHIGSVSAVMTGSFYLDRDEDIWRHLEWSEILNNKSEPHKEENRWWFEVLVCRNTEAFQ